jgi:hypothetical protein
VRRSQQDLGLAAAERELVRTDLEQGLPGPDRGDRQLRHDPARQGDHRPGGHSFDERGECRDRVAREPIGAVEHENERRRARGDRFGQARQRLRPD